MGFPRLTYSLHVASQGELLLSEDTRLPTPAQGCPRYLGYLAGSLFSGDWEIARYSFPFFIMPEPL